MPPTPEQSCAGYANLWRSAKITPVRRADATAIARAIVANRRRYEAVQAKTGVPWPMIGALHNRESGLSFAGHLHNGDSLKGYTWRVPAGRPRLGHGPPFTWEESAIDALTMPGHRLDRVTAWSIERILYECEKYNGWGYLGRCNSPYLWSWTDQYHGGKYVADHVFSAGAWDKQAGCVAVFKALIEINVDAAALFRLAPREAQPPRDAQAAASRKARRAQAGGGVLAGGGAGTEAGRHAGTLQNDQAVAVVHPLFVWGAIGLGIAVVIAAGFVIARQHRLVEFAWTGTAPPAPWIERVMIAGLSRLKALWQRWRAG